MITYNIQLWLWFIGSSGSGVFQKARGDQRKKSPLPPGYEIHIQSPNESICIFPKTRMPRGKRIRPQK